MPSSSNCSFNFSTFRREIPLGVSTLGPDGLASVDHKAFLSSRESKYKLETDASLWKLNAGPSLPSSAAFPLARKLTSHVSSDSYGFYRSASSLRIDISRRLPEVLCPLFSPESPTPLLTSTLSPPRHRRRTASSRLETASPSSLTPTLSLAQASTRRPRSWTSSSRSTRQKTAPSSGPPSPPFVSPNHPFPPALS